MRKLTATIISFLIFVFLLLSPAFAQDNQTAREEKEGKAIWDKLQAKQTTCDALTDEGYERLGEYYMGQMVGDSHQSMNTMMEQMMGKDGEEQMHIVMGKRLSGCDTAAALPQGGVGFMPMMWMLRGGANPMMGWGTAWGTFGFLVSLFWLVLLVDLVLLGIWLWKKIKKEK